MPLSQPAVAAERLVLAITARALFDLEDSHALFQSSGLDAYAQYQRSREKDVLAPGIAFPLVQKLLALNAGAPPETPRVEVVLLSRNSSDSGLRIFNSIRHHGLGIVRAVFTSGAEVYPYIRPFADRNSAIIPATSGNSTRKERIGNPLIAPTRRPRSRRRSGRAA